jgi:ribosome-binding factor A
MNRESYRDKQIAEEIKKTLSSIIFNDIKDPRVKTVNITAVKVTKDLSIARVYYRYFDDLSQKDVQAGLEKSSNIMFNRLRKSMRIKRVPNLTFFFDETPDNADKIEELLRDLNKE